MKKLLIVLIMFISFTGFSQVIIRTLNNVNNTTDTLKPISNAQRTVNTSTTASIATKQNLITGTGLVRVTSGTISYDVSAYITGITSANVTTALGFTPYNATNPSGFISSVPAQTFTSLTGKPTTLGGYGITDAYPLTGNPSAFLTTITSSNVTTALGFTPYNSTNPNGYITSSTVGSTYLPIASPIFTGDIEANTLNSGFITKSPNGTRFRITVSNTGDIVATSL